MKTLNLTSIVLAAASVLLLTPSTSQATCYYNPGFLGSASFDSVGYSLWHCDQGWVNWFVPRYQMDQGDWNNGFGWDAVCNTDQPMARTLDAISFLAWNGTTAPQCSQNTNNVLLWAECYAANSIDELDARCGSGTASGAVRAKSQFGLIVDNWTQLYWPFFYGSDLVERASVLYHESRHAEGWCQHGADSSCPAGGSCDPNLYNGCVGTASSSGMGACGFQVVYLNWYATNARSTMINTQMRASAVAIGNDLLMRHFATSPHLIMLSNGNVVSN